MQLPKIVGVYSDAPQSGKSSVAGWLVEENGYLRLPFAKVLKDMCKPLFAALGYSVVDIHRFETGDKTDFIEITNDGIHLPSGCTVRHIYQCLGTDFGRKMIDPAIWITAWRRSVKQALDDHHYPGVVADDLRYPNEMAALREIGGQAWSVRRPGAVRPNGHESEGQLDCENADFAIENNGTIEDLHNHLTTAWSNK